MKRAIKIIAGAIFCNSCADAVRITTGGQHVTQDHRTPRRQQREARPSALADVTSYYNESAMKPGKTSSAEKERRKQLEARNEAMRAFMRTYESVQSLPSASLPDDEDGMMEFVMLAHNAQELAAKDPEFKKNWAGFWQQQEPRTKADKLDCTDIHTRYSKKRLKRLYSYRSEADLERKAKALCRFGKSATVFIWHMHGGNVGHVGMLLGPPDANFEDYRLKQYDLRDVGAHNEYTPGLGPHKAFSGCKNHPTSWRSGNCFTYVSWWPAAPGVRSNPLTRVEASMHDFDSDQESENPMSPEVIPIDDLSTSEFNSAIEYFQQMRGNPEKTYSLVLENCAIGVAKVLAFGACSGDPCLHDFSKKTKDATGDLAMTLYEESGCEQAECQICHAGDPSCGAASAFGPAW